MKTRRASVFAGIAVTCFLISGVANGGQPAPGVAMSGLHHFMITIEQKRKQEYVKHCWKCLAPWNGLKIIKNIF